MAFNLKIAKIPHMLKPHAVAQFANGSSPSPSMSIKDDTHFEVSLFSPFILLLHSKTSRKMAYDRDNKPAQFLSNWPNAHAPKTPAESTTAPSVHEEALDHVTLNELQQGELYILKIKLIVVALFQGWDDDMCCFSVLRMFRCSFLIASAALSNPILLIQAQICWTSYAGQKQGIYIYIHKLQ